MQNRSTVSKSKYRGAYLLLGFFAAASVLIGIWLIITRPGVLDPVTELRSLPSYPDAQSSVSMIEEPTAQMATVTFTTPDVPENVLAFYQTLLVKEGWLSSWSELNSITYRKLHRWFAGFRFTGISLGKPPPWFDAVHSCTVTGVTVIADRIKVNSIYFTVASISYEIESHDCMPLHFP